MKLQLIKLQVINVKDNIPSNRRVLEDNDVELKDVYFNPTFILSVEKLNTNGDLPMAQSRIAYAAGGFACADTVEDIVNKIQSLEYLT